MACSSNFKKSKVGIKSKAYFFLSNDSINLQEKGTYGFKRTHYPPQSTDLEPFEKYDLNITDVIKFIHNINSYQKKLKRKIKKMKKSSDLSVFADKTSNIDKISTDNYKILLKDNIARIYKHGPTKLETWINLENEA